MTPGGDETFELGTDGPTSILVGVDGSTTAARAGWYAAGLARRQGARVVAVYVEPGPGISGAAPGGAGLIVVQQQAFDEVADDFRQRVGVVSRELGVDFTFIAAHGDPFRELCRIADEIAAAGATMFAVVDHSGEAARAGLSLRDTELLIFGNPRGGTAAMVAAPLAAIDLPLKLLVWEDDEGAVWMSHVDPQWLAERYGLAADVAAPLAAPGALAGRVAAQTGEK